MKKFNSCSVTWFVLILSLVLLTLTACSHHADIRPIIFPDEDNAKCDIPFISGKWQFIHAVDAELPNKRNISFIGITVISSEAKTINCVIMTIEGFVIFDALYDQTLKINRGIAPFDSEAFAKGMIDDIRLIFFKPAGTLIQSGMSDDNAHICRYENDDSLVTDVITTDNHWELRKYDRHSKLVRQVKAYGDKNPDSPIIPEKLELSAYGDNPYALKLKLIECEPI